MKLNHQCLSILTTDLLLMGIMATFEGVGATWWFLSQLQMSTVGAKIMCDNIPGLVRRQKYMCQRHPDAMLSVSKGARMAVTECQNQFRNQRWNCSTIERDASVFGKVLLRSSREAAFVYALTSAGVVHALTRACSKGEFKNCVCDPSKTGRHRDGLGEFTWGGCSDFIRYGSIFAKKFVDAPESGQKDARALMNLHNNRAGRKAVQKHVRLQCKCHGVSGSCAVRTCWVALMDFRRVASYLKRRYDGAVQVLMSQSGAELIVANQNHKRPTGSDLVYFEASPDYCVKDEYTGSLGTAGRICNKTSLGTSGCDIMCCGRGYDTKRELFVRKCNCRFQWCCFVKCSTCQEWRDVHTCKPPRSTSITSSVSRDMRDLGTRRFDCTNVNGNLSSSTREREGPLNRTGNFSKLSKRRRKRRRVWR